jgi:hypothetical protein
MDPPFDSEGYQDNLSWSSLFPFSEFSWDPSSQDQLWLNAQNQSLQNQNLQNIQQQYLQQPNPQQQSLLFTNINSCTISPSDILVGSTLPSLQSKMNQPTGSLDPPPCVEQNNSILTNVIDDNVSAIQTTSAPESETVLEPSSSVLSDAVVSELKELDVICVPEFIKTLYR